MTAEEAITMTRTLAAERGWQVVEPVHAQLHRPWWGKPPRWIVISNWGSLGCIVRVEIDDRTGEIVSKGYVPR